MVRLAGAGVKSYTTGSIYMSRDSNYYINHNLNTTDIISVQFRVNGTTPFFDFYTDNNYNLGCCWWIVDANTVGFNYRANTILGGETGTLHVFAK